MESEHLGMSTIAVLHLLDRRKNKKDKDIDKKLIKAVITERILNNNIPKLATCDASLYNGVAGYLYALLCIDKGLAEYQEEEDAKAERLQDFEDRGFYHGTDDPCAIERIEAQEAFDDRYAMFMNEH